MHYASVENLTKSFGIRTLFKDISFYIEQGDKIALVARNGSGKSTLLNILTGNDTADEGTIWIHKDIKVILLQQQNEFDEEKTIWEHLLNLDNPIVELVKEYEELSSQESADEQRLSELVSQLTEANAWNFESDVQQVLGKLNINHPDKKIKTLSGGQQKRVALAQALLESQLHEGHCLLILDEPTNHLDVEMIEWLENFLSTQKSTLLLVTHDRYFLDTVCNVIYELDGEQHSPTRETMIIFWNKKPCARKCSRVNCTKTKIFSAKNWNGCASSPKQELLNLKAARMPSTNFMRK